MMQARLVGLAVLAVSFVVGCGKDVAPTNAPPMDPEVAAKAVLLGTGKTCENDRGCGTIPAAGACLLGTCFGLLTSDSPAIRTVLTERLGQLTPATQAFAEQALLNALGHEETSRRAQVAALEGVGELFKHRDTSQCGRACTALRRYANVTDTMLSTAARLALAQRADVAAFPELIKDLQLGTPHLAVAAARAMLPYCVTSSRSQAAAALEAATKSTDLALRDAASAALKRCGASAKTAAKAQLGGKS